MEASDFNVEGWGFELAEKIRENPDHWMNHVEHQWWPEDTGEKIEVKETTRKKGLKGPPIAQTLITYRLQQTALASSSFVGEKFDEIKETHIKEAMFQNAEWVFQERIKHGATRLLPRIKTNKDIPVEAREIADTYPGHFLTRSLTEKPIPSFIVTTPKKGGVLWQRNKAYDKAPYKERVFLHPESLICYTPPGIGVDQEVQGPVCSLGDWHVLEAWKTIPRDIEDLSKGFKFVSYDPPRFCVRAIFSNAIAPHRPELGAVMRVKRDGQEQR